ncbi:MAG: exodeoxyribonuclease VII large subunit, partial [Alphaproteobacteria bacterium]|nr:exodeoxyribonuclease VII large subunit [Alphaproteobacteria bacterium]
IVVESLELAGEGALLALHEKTKARLAAEGLFAPAHKRSLPALPHRIGIVTSPTGAVIHDIIHRLEARFPVEVIVWPVLVQGNGSAQQVVAAVEGFSALPPSARPDLVIIARGGGSIEDLWTFNEEIVVRAIAASLIPTISAVGHETDTTLADYAADLRAPTPTAAAELAVPVRAQLAAAIESLHLRSLKAISNKAERARERFEAQARRLPSGDTLLGQVRQRFDDRSAALVRGLADRIALSRLMLSGVSAALRPVVLTNRLTLKQERFYQLNQHIKPDILQTRLSDARTRLEQTWRLAQSFHPDRPLALGYARIETHRGDTVTTARAAQAARHLRLRFRDGAVDTIVDSKDVSPPLEPKRPRPYKDKSVQPKLL